MKKVICILVLMTTFSFSAGWYVQKDVDAMTDKVEKMAIVKNNKGHSFMIYKIGEEVWANFALSDNIFDTLDYEKSLIMRIDKNKATRIKQLKGLGEMVYNREFYVWKPKWINFILGKSKDEQMLKTINLKNLMNGSVLKVRYFISTGGYKDTSFTLKGSSKVIKEILEDEI
ncbi:hypothetical protein [Arcobacter roscoffensis]|uniref:Uncharacterized protein n=1 Tax=Arcobacter roscoffensis TaxID=2961520 RepID=A0ABY5E3N0_9BACT|nr:hypothetical protein [Arcobacter roscoffensis]UTJ05375.1 hypothetical protein NJU99_08850 [Arcobacter roscoffensis]